MEIARFVLLGSIGLLGTVLAVLVALRRQRAETQVPATLAGQWTPDPVEAPTQVLPRAEAPPASNDDGWEWLALATDELRTPIRLLRGQIEVLHQRVATGSRQPLLPLTERLLAQVTQLEELIAAWVASARQSGPQPIPAARPVEVQALACSVCAYLTRPEEPPFEVAKGPPIWALLDPAALEQALTLMVQGARLAAPNSLVEVVVRVVGQGTAQRLCIAVADRRSPTTDAGAQLRASLEHDLVRVLLEGHQGQLEAEPRGGGGVVTTLWLPAAVLIPAAHQPSATRDQPLPRAA